MGRRAGDSGLDAGALIYGKEGRGTREDMMSAGLGALRRLWRGNAVPDTVAAEPADAPIVAEDERLPPREIPTQCPELGPFMRVLHDAGIVTGNLGPKQSGHSTYWRLQSLVYLAVHNFGHPGLKYIYRPYVHGPYSLALANDFYRFDSMCGSEPVSSEEWEGLGAFMEFARNYRSLDWLSVAATLSYVNEKVLAGELSCRADHAHDRRSCLVELASVEIIDFSKEGMCRVYESIKDVLPGRTSEGEIAA